MAITKSGVSLLFQLSKKVHLEGTVCQLGRQTVLISPDAVSNIANNYGSSVSTDKFEMPWTGNADDKFLFEGLGFNLVESLDAEKFEGASHQADLNIEVPKYLWNRFDAIYDGGTIEHVFNIPQVMKNIHLMLKPNGLVMHASPTNNFVDHGFYMFSPTFFHDYYSANGYEIILENLCELNKNPANQHWKIYDYSPLSIENLAYGGWGKSLLGTWFVARKNTHSTSGIAPMQGRYKKVWKASKEVKAPLGKDKLWNKVKLTIKSSKALYNFFYKIRECILAIRFIFRKNKKPKPLKMNF